MKKNVKNYALIACLSVGLIASATGVVTVSADGTSLVSTDLTMTQGASLYLKEVSGLKFQYTIANYDDGANKNYGMLIVPYDYLDDAGITDLTLNTNDYVQALQAATLPYEPIIVENLQPSEAGVVEYSIGQLNENNYAREFFGIGFEKTGENSYVYAKQSDNVRSVFEVANLALNKLHFGEWDLTDEKQAAEKELLASKEQSVLNPFITTGFEFVYGTATPTLTVEASAVDGEATPVITATKVKDVELKMHWNYVSEDEEIASVANGKIKGEARGQSKITASLGNAISVDATAAVLKDATELELYNNSHKADFFAEEGKISLTGGYYNNSSANTEQRNNADTSRTTMGYVAFEDTYTLDENGTYIDVYFTGNNMPNVEFFASEINGLFMDAYDTDGTGFIVSNGLSAAYGSASNTTYKYGFSGYRGYFAFGVSSYAERWIGVEDWHLGALAGWDGKTAENLGSSGQPYTYSNFSMYSLANVQSAEQNYRYNVGMYKDADGYVYIEASLYKVNGNSENLFAYWNSKVSLAGNASSVSKDKLAEGESISGKIVLHAAAKGVDAEYAPLSNEFTCSAPYAGNAATRYTKAENATFNNDGTVTVKNGKGTTHNYTNLTAGYTVLDDDYQLGEYVDIYFTGDNMPHMSFFANQVTNTMHNGGSGFVMRNGAGYENESSTLGYSMYAGHAHSLMVLNPDRGATTSFADGGSSALIARDRSTTLSTSLTNETALAKAHPLSMYMLAAKYAETKFKMTVGFCENADGYVELVIDADMWDKTSQTWVTYYDLTKASTLHAKNDADKLGKYLIAYGAQRNANSSITFSYSAPYTK